MSRKYDEQEILSIKLAVFYKENPTLFSFFVRKLCLDRNHTHNANFAIYREGQRNALSLLFELCEKGQDLINKNKGGVE